MTARQAVLRRINNERGRRGLRALSSGRGLRRSAQAKARHLARTGKLEHGRWWVLLYKFAGRRYGQTGEIIARGQRTSVEVVEDWMDSATHRAEVLGPYVAAGVGQARARDGRTYWVVHFGGAR